MLRSIFLRSHSGGLIWAHRSRNERRTEICPEGAGQQSPGSRSAPWDPNHIVNTPTGLNRRCEGLSNPFRVSALCSLTQGALRDPGLCYLSPTENKQQKAQIQKAPARGSVCLAGASGWYADSWLSMARLFVPLPRLLSPDSCPLTPDS